MEWPPVIDDRPGRKLAHMLFGQPQDGSVCGMCGSAKVEYADFQDEISRKEFAISLMCQDCQDRIFVREDEDE